MIGKSKSGKATTFDAELGFAVISDQGKHAQSGYHRSAHSEQGESMYRISESCQNVRQLTGES
jgi:hypothetical protein